MKKWLVRGSLFCCGYVILLLATLPATVALGFISVPKNVQLSGVAGTIWQASVEQLQIENIVVNRVSASLSTLSLLLANPSVEVNFGGGLLDGPSGKLTISGFNGALAVHDAEIELAANEVVQQLSLPFAVDASGVLRLSVAQFLAGKPLCDHALGNIVWQKSALSAMNESVSLGALEAKISCDKGAMVFTVNPKNQLGLSLSAYLNAPGNLTGNGYLTPGPQFPEKLTQLLPFLGKTDNQGRYRLQF